VGKRADLVLLAGNPLRDIRYTAGPAGVMIGGRWLSEAELAVGNPELQRQAAQHRGIRLIRVSASDSMARNATTHGVGDLCERLRAGTQP
jgi:hypothetical protein